MKKQIATFTAAILMLVASGAMADVVMTVDISNPYNIIVTATSGTASNNVTFTLNQGINLKGFLTAPRTGAMVGSGSGTFAAVGQSPMNTWNSPGTTFRGFEPDDILFYGSAADVINLTAGTVPFAGTSTYDMHDISSLLPSIGTTGELRGLNSGNYDSGLIGQWEVIPEPATLALLSAGAVALLRRRKK